MVKIAQSIKNKIRSKELSENEMSEIQEVMFNMGMTEGFTSHVSKEISGKKFYQDLAKEIEKFLDKVINSERFSGVIGLIDLFCLYNRARGTDLVSPEDMNIACAAMHEFSQKYMIKSYTKSGIKTIQLKSFNEVAYFEKLAAKLSENPGMTADRIASLLKINVTVIREQITQAEALGYICIDESHEGLRYHPNLFRTFTL